MSDIILNPDKGLGIPIKTTAAKDAITSPATGALVYDSDQGVINQYTGSAWQGVLTTAGVPASAMPAGSVVQVVATENTTTSTMGTSGGFTNFSSVSGHSVTITPSSASNKVFIFYMAPLTQNNEANNALFVQLLRGGTVVGAGSGGSPNVSAAVPNTYQSEYYVTGSMGHTILFYLDSPATTSATTYSIQVASRLSTTVYVNSAANTSYRGMTRMYAIEVKG